VTRVSAADLSDQAADRVCQACGAPNLRTSSRCYACGQELPLPGHGDQMPAPKGGPLTGDDKITIRLAWRLGVNSFRVVARNPSLLLFPLVGGGGALGALALLGLGIYLLHPNPSTLPFWFLTQPNWFVLFAVAAYVSVVIVTTLALAGLVGATALALQGGHPSVRDGWRVARKHIGRVIIFGLLDATVGLALALLARRLGFLGGVLRVVAGLAWWLATYFVVQVLVLEDQPLLPSIYRSARFMRHLFGDVVFSNILASLLTVVGLVLLLGGVIYGTIATLLWGPSAVYLGLALGGGIGGLFLMLIGSTVSVVVTTGLYRYAATGELDPTLFRRVIGSDAR